MERNDPMTMSRLKAYRRNASAIEDIKAELSGKYDGKKRPNDHVTPESLPQERLSH
uniref:Uncharacterized protein n=1 Tax=Phage sp. ctfRs3 TaxID=2826751 RepID=A0A8S5QTR6_9VIRU|nr:MAG TPA: hypothetical protein [Phage sp. ctfRs3]